jgi:GH15 family glucan-1,4-alpha-glucosidase
VSPISKKFFTDFLALPLSSLAQGSSDLSQDAIQFTRKDPEFRLILQAVLEKGDTFLRRVKQHAPDGRLSEQFTGSGGLRRGAKDLTWSYAALITASHARSDLLKSSFDTLFPW